MNNTRRKIKNLKSEIERCAINIRRFISERDERVALLCSQEQLHTLPYDRQIKGANKRIKNEEERLERLKLGLPHLEEKLRQENESVRENVLVFLQNEEDQVINAHTERLSLFREKQRELQKMQKEVGELYNKKRAVAGLVSNVKNLLTADAIQDLQTNPAYILEKNPELKNLFSSFPELAEAINADIIKTIKAQDLSRQKEQEQKKKEKDERIAKNRSLFQTARDWYKARKIPKELGVTIQGLTPDSLFEYWKSYGIDPKNSYDQHGNFIQRRAIK